MMGRMQVQYNIHYTHYTHTVNIHYTHYTHTVNIHYTHYTHTVHAADYAAVVLALEGSGDGDRGNGSSTRNGSVTIRGQEQGGEEEGKEGLTELFAYCDAMVSAPPGARDSIGALARLAREVKARSHHRTHSQSSPHSLNRTHHITLTLHSTHDTAHSLALIKLTQSLITSHSSHSSNSLITSH
jgi:hypothetical protein